MGQRLISSKFEELRALADEWLNAELARIDLQPGLREACSTSLLSPGKRLRPILTLAVAEALEVPLEALRPVALALELIHTSSLIHDDLPALDNDDLRRGEPTCHKRFGEGIALLAGDVLLLRAFGLLAEAPAPAATVVAWTNLLATAGVKLCNGQTLDLRLAGKSGPVVAPADDNVLESLCFMKTAALFRASVMAPLYALPLEQWSKLEPSLSDLGNQLGLLFQITDDLLDSGEESSHDESEINWAQKYGVEAADARADKALNAAEAALAVLGSRGDFLLDLVRAVRSRRS
ncbi:MAG: polyprenyl synthetase family protein [Bdellovibrionota bacterium]